MTEKNRVALISLGCAKNLVSSEQMLHALGQAGFILQEDCAGADAVVVNTCGFIEDAKREAIDRILQLAVLKDKGSIGRILVAGCLAERYREDILREIPEVDGLVGCGSFHRVAQAVSSVLAGDATPPCFFDPPGDIPLGSPRLVTTPPHTAYLKVAEGCDNRCAYCVIPALRGPYRSRPVEELLDEARLLVDAGAREIILIAQDTTRYGLDLYGKRRLPELLAALCSIEGLRWLRLHYLYPDLVDDRLIDVVAEQDKIQKYLDIPIQHCNDRLLRAMERRGGRADIEALLARLRLRIPDLVLRTSLIVGLPGETEEDFEELCEFMRRTRWQRAGVFPYSREEGTPAADMPGQIDAAVKRARAEAVMALQQTIMEDFHRSLVGRTVAVLVEGYDPATRLHSGRSWADSPEVDPGVTFTARRRVSVGRIVPVRITDLRDGDPFGRYLGGEAST